MTRIAAPAEDTYPSPLGRVVCDEDTVRIAQAYLYARAQGLAPDTELVEAWNRLYSAYDPLIRRLACRRYMQYTDRQDACQEIWCAIIANLGHYEPGRGSLDSWLGGLAWRIMVGRSRVSGRCRSTGLGIECVSDVRICDPAELYEMVETHEQLVAGMAELRNTVSPKTYRIFHDHWLETKACSELAATLGLTVRQVRDRDRRAMARFRTIMSRPPRRRLGVLAGT